MPWLDEVPVVLQLWFPGQEIGDALADVLTGEAEPGGRLPITFPRQLEDTPAFAHYPGTDGRAVYGERLLIGHRWYDRHELEPLFPFGFGLGYTRFELDAPVVEGSAEHGASVEVTVKNVGDRAGGEVVQVYVEPPEGDADRPRRQLAGFRRVDLPEGREERVRIDLDRRAFASWIDGEWQVPPGEYTVLVGRSSRQLQPIAKIR
jgi:beta-glucosidase